MMTFRFWHPNLHTEFSNWFEFRGPHSPCAPGAKIQIITKSDREKKTYPDSRIRLVEDVDWKLPNWHPKRVVAWRHAWGKFGAPLIELTGDGSDC